MMGTALLISPYEFPTPSLLNLGDTSEGTDVFPFTDGRVLVSKFTLGQSITRIRAILAYRGSTSTVGSNMKGVILSDSAGVPNATLAVSEGVPCIAGAGWQQMTVAGVIPLSAGDYWIGIVADSFQGRLGHDTSVGSMLRAEGYTYSSPPAWPGTADTYVGEASVYAVLEI